MRSSTQSTANRLHSYQKLTALDDDRNIFYSSQTSWKALRMECCKFPGDIVSFLLNCNTKKAYHVTISRFKTQVSNSTEDPDQSHILNLAREVSNPALIRMSQILFTWQPITGMRTFEPLFFPSSLYKVCFFEYSVHIC